MGGVWRGPWGPGTMDPGTWPRKGPEGGAMKMGKVVGLAALAALASFTFLQADLKAG